MRQKEPYPDYGDYPHLGHGNVNGGYMMKWMLVLFSGVILVALTAAIAWGVSESSRVSALEVGQASINAKLDQILEKVSHNARHP